MRRWNFSSGFTLWIPIWHRPCKDPPKTFTRMKITLEIGEKEKSRIEYQYNQLLGRLVIKVNDQTVAHSIRLLNEPVLEIHVLTVGQHERHQIRIEKERKPLLGHRSRLFVNNRLCEVFSTN
jgi:hypothetical protein